MNILERIKGTVKGVKEKKNSLRNAYMTAFAVLTIYLAEAERSEAAIGDTVKEGINSVYVQIFGVITPLFALILLIGGARIFVNNGRKFDGIMDWLKRAGFAYIAILLIAEIIGFIKNLAGGGTDSVLGL